MNIYFLKTQFDITSVKWMANTKEETSLDRAGVTPCKVSSAPPGRSGMAKGTTYIWPRHKGMSAVCASLREICLPAWSREQTLHSVLFGLYMKLRLCY